MIHIIYQGNNSMPRYRGDLETEKLPPKKGIGPHPPPPTKKDVLYTSKKL